LWFLKEELTLNRFDFCINNGLTLIVDEHDELSLASFIAFSRSFEISFRFATFNWDWFALSNEERLTKWWFITFAIEFWAYLMFEERFNSTFPLSSYFWSFEIKITNKMVEVSISNIPKIKTTYQFLSE
jgi:hypothetical protein